MVGRLRTIDCRSELKRVDHLNGALFVSTLFTRKLRMLRAVQSSLFKQGVTAYNGRRIAWPVGDKQAETISQRKHCDRAPPATFPSVYGASISFTTTLFLMPSSSSTFSPWLSYFFANSGEW